MFSKVVACSFVLMSFAAHATYWQAPSEGKIVKVCGSASQEKTPYDGVQFVFEEKDSEGKMVNRVFLKPMGKSLEAELSYWKMGEKRDICVMGIKSERMMIDSPKSFYTFETF